MNSKLGTGCGILFLLPFAAVGVFMAFLVLWSVYDHARMKNWAEVPATLTQLKQTRGDDSTGVEATYTYEYAGKQYTGERVAIHSGSDNIGSFQNRLFSELKEAEKKQQAVPCYVNPSSPGEAVLNRDLRPEMVMFKAIFGLVFGGVGIGGWVGMWLFNRKQTVKKVEEQKHPEELWLWRDDWREGVIKSERGMAVLGIAAFALFWNLISWPVFVGAWLSEDKQEWFVLPLVGLFPLIGSIMLIVLVVMYFRWRRFRGNYFRMASVPGVIGGKLAGVIVIPKAVTPDDGFIVRLKCVQQVGSGEDSKTVTRHEQENLIAHTLNSGEPGETNVPVMFTIPSSARATDEESQLKWTVECSAALPGPDLDLSYEVPVFRTADSRDDVNVEDDQALLADYVVSEPLDASLAREGIRMERGHHPDETAFRTPPGRNVGMCLSLTLFAVIWTGVCIGLWWHKVWFFASVFTLFDLVIVPAMFSCWLSSRVLTIKRDRWNVRSGWWPVLWSSKDFDSADVSRFYLKSNMSSGEKKWNQLLVKLRNQKNPVVLSHGLTSRRVEQLWINDLRERAGLTEGSVNNDDEDEDEGLVLEREMDE